MIDNVSELQSPVGLQATMTNLVGYEGARNTKALPSMDEDTKPTSFQELLKELESVSLSRLMELMKELSDSDEDSEIKGIGFSVLGTAIEKRLKHEKCSCDNPADMMIVSLQGCACGIRVPHLHCTQCGCVSKIGF